MIIELPFRFADFSEKWLEMQKAITAAQLGYDLTDDFVAKNLARDQFETWFFDNGGYFEDHYVGSSINADGLDVSLYQANVPLLGFSDHQFLFQFDSECGLEMKLALLFKLTWGGDR